MNPPRSLPATTRLKASMTAAPKTNAEKGSIRLPIDTKKRTRNKSFRVESFSARNLDCFPLMESPIMNAPIPGEYPRTAASTENEMPRVGAKRNGISASPRHTN